MNEIPASSDELDAGQPHQDSRFRHLHPLSIILKSVASLGQNLIAMGVLYFSVFDQNIVYAGLAALVLMALIVGITTLVWSRFTYHIGEREIRIKSGVLSRNNRSIPFDRIQDVSLEQKLVSRILGLATVKLETGASSGEDGKLDALTLEDARVFRDIIRDYKSGNAAGAKETDDAMPSHAEEAEKPPLFAMDNRRILIAGLFNFSFILLAILGAVAQNLDFLIPSEYFDPWYWAGQFTDRNVIDGLSFSARIAGILGALFTLIVIGFGSGIIRTFIREYGFRLDRVDTGQPGFRRRRGLFTLTDMVMPIHRVQAAIIKTGPVRERFGWYHLKFQSLASDVGSGSDHSAAPCADPAEIDNILQETTIRNGGSDMNFLGVHAAHWWRNCLLPVLILIVASTGLAVFLNPAFLVMVVLMPPVIILSILNWRRHGYLLSDTQLYVRSGWWRRKLAILPVRKIQTVDVSQSPLDHPLELATLTVGIAGGSPIRPLKIQSVPFEQAMALRNQLI